MLRGRLLLCPKCSYSTRHRQNKQHHDSLVRPPRPRLARHQPRKPLIGQRPRRRVVRLPEAIPLLPIVSNRLCAANRTERSGRDPRPTPRSPSFTSPADRSHSHSHMNKSSREFTYDYARRAANRRGHASPVPCRFADRQLRRPWRVDRAARTPTTSGRVGGLCPLRRSGGRVVARRGWARCRCRGVGIANVLGSARRSRSRRMPAGRLLSADHLGAPDRLSWYSRFPMMPAGEPQLDSPLYGALTGVHARFGEDARSRGSLCRGRGAVDGAAAAANARGLGRRGTSCRRWRLHRGRCGTARAEAPAGWMTVRELGLVEMIEAGLRGV